jgi:hypothetical protein
MDAQTVWVLVLAAGLVFVHRAVGSRKLFRSELSHFFPEHLQGVLEWSWWFAMKGVAGFVIPVLVLLFVFKCRPKAIGLGLGDARFAFTVLALYTPLVALGTWILSASPEFQSAYPHYRGAVDSWTLLLIYEISYLAYWIGWEYLWRGFVLFGTARTFGYYAILVQALPFAVLHASKPIPEQFLSIVGGIALGAVVWRCRSFWVAVPIHAIQMAFLDLWCTLRIRTGVAGTSSTHLLDLLRP